MARRKKKIKKLSLRDKLDLVCDKIDSVLKCLNVLRQSLKLFDLCRSKLAALLGYLKGKVK